MVLELLEVEVRFVAYRHAVTDYIRALGGVVPRLDEVVGDIDGFVVSTLDDFAVQR